MLDVYAPTAAGPWPVVVLLRGGPGGLGARTALAAFAEAIAAHGVVVLNADYRDNARSGGGFPRPFDDVACAIRFARTVAGRWGGDASSVTLVGHSLGAYVGSVVSLSPDTYGSACLASSGSGIPDAFVGISGPYLLGEQDVHAALATVLGGEPGELPDAWARADPLALATTPRTVHVGLVHGTTDKTVDVQASRSLANALADAGDSVLFRERPAGDHGTVVDPTTSDGQSSIALIVAFSRGRLPQS